MSTQDCIAWCVGLVMVVALVAMPVACTANRHSQIAKAIEAGADPLEAKCAIEGDNSSNVVCVVLASKKGNHDAIQPVH
jgi:hypothetical protein